VDSGSCVEAGRAGDGRLLHDCGVVGQMLTSDRPAAGERLEREVGARLAALLHSALTGDQTLQHSWQAAAAASRASAGASDSDPPVWSLPSGNGRIVVLRPELPTAVSLGTGRKKKRRMVSQVGANQARARKAALNEGLQPEPSSTLAPTDQVVELAYECSDASCSTQIMLTPDEYTFLRTVSGYYAVAPDHVSPDDHIIIIGEPDRFAIVE
jgi:hypothetical protein